MIGKGPCKDQTCPHRQSSKTIAPKHRMSSSRVLLFKRHILTRHSHIYRRVRRHLSVQTGTDRHWRHLNRLSIFQGRHHRHRRQCHHRRPPRPRRRQTRHSFPNSFAPRSLNSKIKKILVESYKLFIFMKFIEIFNLILQK